MGASKKADWREERHLPCLGTASTKERNKKTELERIASERRCSEPGTKTFSCMDAFPSKGGPP